jgi:hypothetical protein
VVFEKEDYKKRSSDAPIKGRAKKKEILNFHMDDEKESALVDAA